MEEPLMNTVRSRRPRRFAARLTARLAACVGAAACLLSLATAAAAGGFNTPGNILIADQFNNRVIEIDRQ
ncbi:MAG: hypothetical protein OSA97_05070, partial [Nevskia sp.]|nr:hypothetical protein [Nevskia sp.]